MKTQLEYALLITSACLLASHAWAATETVYQCVEPDGTVLLSNSASGNDCRPVASGEVTPTPAGGASADAAKVIRKDTAAEGAATQAADRAASSVAPSGVTRREELLTRYRDKMLQDAANAQGTPAAAKNPAAVRRYLKTDRATDAPANGVTEVAP